MHFKTHFFVDFFINMDSKIFHMQFKKAKLGHSHVENRD